MTKQERVRFTGPTSIQENDLEIYTEKGYHDVKTENSYFGNYPRYRRGTQMAEAENVIIIRKKVLSDLRLMF